MTGWTATVEKVNCFTVRNKYAHASAIVRTWRGGGSIDIQSDLGKYSGTWNAIGENNFLEWITGLSFNYFMRKTTTHHGEELDFEASINNLKQIVMDHRRDGTWSKDQARSEWECIEAISDTTDAWAFAKEVDEFCDWAYEHLCDNAIIRMKRRADAEEFWKNHWVALCEAFANKDQLAMAS